MTPRPGGDTPGADGAAARSAPAETRPLNAIALAQEVVLDRIERLLAWLLARLRRYRAGRGDWWER